jgi:hypothetical protein
MKNILILITIILSSSVQLLSQKGITKKSAIDFSIDFKPASRYALTRSDNIEGEFSDRIIPLLSLHVEYKYAISNKLAVGLIYENGKADFGSYQTENQIVDYNFGSLYIQEVYSFKSPAINTNYGVSLNVFTKGFVAPVGNSFSFYYKRNFAKVEEVTREYYYDNNNITTDLESANLILKTNTLGMSFNGMVFLSDKQPFYINYGLGIGFTFGTKIDFNDKEIKQADYYEDAGFRNLRNVLLYNEILNFKVGVGYWL